ncbi:MAG TPA: YjbE family putative metal transport protein [Ktedonobacterales bacterium]|nr:YjbE family putative metal transport protein [Ktedonobacterales bacterium]
MPNVIAQWLIPVLGIVLVDLALSGDNALVIGAAASKLQGAQRRFAITFGGLAAIILRIGLTIVAVFLLRIPFLNVVGGLLVLIIAINLVRDMYDAEETLEGAKSGNRRQFKSQAKLFGACATIVMADVSMSLDNVLAIAALARNNFVVLVIGLLLSVFFLLLASSVIAAIMERYPVLLYLAGGVLAWTAASMILNDQGIKPAVQQWDNAVPGPLLLYIELGFVVIFALGSLWWWNRHRQQLAQTALPPTIKRQN